MSRSWIWPSLPSLMAKLCMNLCLVPIICLLGPATSLTSTLLIVHIGFAAVLQTHQAQGAPSIFLWNDLSEAFPGPPSKIQATLPRHFMSSFPAYCFPSALAHYIFYLFIICFPYWKGNSTRAEIFVYFVLSISLRLRIVLGV